MPTKASDWIGIEIAHGRYKIERILGEGGMGSIFLGEDANLDDHVVIKIPQFFLLGNEEFTKRFALEVRSLVRLNHPHIVKIRDVGEHDGVPFAVMQYLGGGSLADQRGEENGRPIPMSVDKIVDWLPDVAEALDFVHTQHFLHRDIKPANILFDEHGNVYLGDFGVAKAMAAAKEHDHVEALTGGGFVGTAEYIAPEAIMGQAVTGAADQYSLAVSVYELLAGQRPFQGPNPAAVLVKQTTDPPPPLSLARPDLPGELCEVVHRGLQKDPAARFATCSAFANAFVDAASAKSRAICPSCKQKLKVKYSLLGKLIKCPKCQRQIVVDFADQTAVATTSGGETMVVGDAFSDTDRVKKPQPWPATAQPGATTVRPGNASGPQPAAGSTLVQSGRPTPQGAGSTMVHSPGRGGLANVQRQVLNQGGQTLVGSGPALKKPGRKRNSRGGAFKVLISLVGIVIGMVAVACAAVVVLFNNEPQGRQDDAVVADASNDAAVPPLPAVVADASGLDLASLEGGGPAGVTEPASNDQSAVEPTMEEAPSTGDADELKNRLASLEKANRSAAERLEQQSAKPAPADLPIPPDPPTAQSPGGPTTPNAKPQISPEERQRMVEEELKRRAKVAEAVHRRAPLPKLGITVEPQNLIDVARGKEKPPYTPPAKQMVRIAKTRTQADPLGRTARTETYYVRQETLASRAQREAYRVLYYTKILPNYSDEKIEVFEKEATVKAEKKGIFKEEMLADIQRIRNAYGLVRSGLNKDDVTKYCELCAEFAVKFGDGSTIPDHYYELADAAPEAGSPDEELGELEDKLRNTVLLHQQWRFKDPVKSARYEREIEDLEEKIKELKSSGEGKKEAPDLKDESSEPVKP